MVYRHWVRIFLMLVLIICGGLCPCAFAQYSNYNSYGYGNNYNSGYNSGYGNSYNSGYGNYGNSSGFGSSFGNSGFGNSGFGSSSRSGRRSSRGGSYSNSQYGNSQYGNSQYGNSGYQNNQYGSSRRSSRSSSYGNQNYSGQVPNTAASQSNNPNQTTPSGTDQNRRNALKGKTAARGALSSGGAAATTPAAGAQGTPAAGRPAAKKSEIKTKPMATLYLSTPSPVALVNQPKVVSVILSNSNKVEFDRVAFTLQYDPDDVKPVMAQEADGSWKTATSIALNSPDEPVVADSSSTTESAESKSESDGYFIGKDPKKYTVITNTIDAQKGEIRFEAKVNGTSVDGGELADITFVPLRETNTTISFVFNDLDGNSGVDAKPLTALELKNNDQLGSRFSASDGVINLDFEIYKSLADARKPLGVKKASDRYEEETGDETDMDTRLSLIPRKSNIEVGDVVEVDVKISNPKREKIDAISLLVAFNPRVFEPVDGNDFDSGLNIDDKEYKENFPLDFPLLNTIDADKGVIDYRKKSIRKAVQGEGVLATIRLKAIAPTVKTTFRMFINENGEEPTTGVFYHNQDRLGNPSDPYDGVNTCSIEVRPTVAYLRKYR